MSTIVQRVKIGVLSCTLCL